MRNLRVFGVVMAFLAAAPGLGIASDSDDSPLAQQIIVSVAKYRRIDRDMQRLTESLKRQPGVQNVFDAPAMQDFLHDSMNPAHAQLQDLLARYREEVGTKALAKFAARQGFADLLDPDRN